jgi:hypothetical protein
MPIFSSLPPADSLSIAKNIRPEDAFLLVCAGALSDPDKTGRIKALIRKGIDWVYLIERSRSHALVPLLHQTLERLKIDEVPGEIQLKINEDFRKSVFWNLVLVGELRNLARLFEENGIRYIPYKGPTLAVLLYGDFSLRQCDDLDILVHKRDIFKIKELLIAGGYRPEFDLSPSQERAYLDSNCEYNFYSEKRRIHLEIHWDFLPNYFAFPFDLEASWDRLVPLPVGGKAFLTFSKEDLMLPLCAHYGFKHQWERLGWIYDYARLIEGLPQSVWEHTLDRAKRMGIERGLFLGLWLARGLIGITLPRAVLEKLDRDPRAKECYEAVCERLFHDFNNPIRIYKDQFLLLKMRERFRDKMRYVYYLVSTPNVKDWRLVSVGGRVPKFSGLVRPFRLVVKYGLRLILSLFGKKNTHQGT